MKKILAIILALVLVLSLAACGGNETPEGSENSGEQSGEVNGNTNGDGSGAQQPSGNGSDGSGSAATNPTNTYASERTINTAGAVDSIDDLANTYHKLTAEKKLHIVYLGGSVTDGHGGSDGYCWRSATTEWFKSNFPSAEITDTNAGWGGTGSYWGFFRMDEAVLAYNPDLVFIEFAINDAYAGHSRLQSSLYMEGIVRKIREQNPKCDIVFVFVTDNNGAGRMGKEYDQLLGHKDVAAHYGIPTINVGFALVDEMNRTGNGWEYYVMDIVHPNNKGYKVYADCVAEHLQNWLVTSPNKAGLNDHERPANDLVSNLSTQSEIVKAEKLTNYTGFTLFNSKNNLVSHVGKTLYGAKGSVIEFEFTGRGLGILVDAERLPTVKITVDGKETIVKKFTGTMSEVQLLDNLSYGKHTVKIEVIDGTKIVIGGFLVAK